MNTVASFTIGYRQVLDPEGRIVDALPEFARDPAVLVDLYQRMSFTRVFDGKAVALQRTGKLGTYASCLGHEAAHIAIGVAMQPEDVFCPMYREYGAQFVRGVKPRHVLLYWGGDERGNDFTGPKHDLPGACRSRPSACMPPVPRSRSSCVTNRGWRSAWLATAARPMSRTRPTPT